MNLLKVLKDAGLSVNPVPGWETRARPGSFGPVGIMLHHTAGTNSLTVIVEGRSDLAGPLANLHLPKDGTCNLVANGRCNHAGAGSSTVLGETRNDLAPPGDARVRGLKDDIGGNAYYYGIEVENLGDGRDPYPQPQLDALAGACAAICRHAGWSANRVVMHREWTARHINMSYRGPIRESVAALIRGQTSGEYEEEDVKTKFITITLDANGNGHNEWDPGLGRDPVIIGVVKQGPFPPVDGYWPEQGPVDLSAQPRSGKAVVVARGGVPGKRVSCFLAVA